MEAISKVISLFQKEITAHNKGFKPYPIDDQINKVASLFAPGDSYYYILNFYDLNIDYVAPSVKGILGVEPQDFSIQKLLELCHPDDLPLVYKREEIVISHLNSINTQNQLFYKYSYLFNVKNSSGQYRKLLHQATAITLSEENKIGHVLAVHIDVSHLKIIDDKTISIIGLKDDLPSYYNIDPENPDFESKRHENPLFLVNILSEREIEVVHFISEGLNADEIAERLHISQHTVRTHRKNILQKTGCANSAELVSRCLLEGVI